MNRTIKYAVTFTCWFVAGIIGLLLIGSAFDDSISAAQAIVALAIVVALLWIGYAIWTPPRNRLPSR